MGLTHTETMTTFSFVAPNLQEMWRYVDASLVELQRMHRTPLCSVQKGQLLPVMVIVVVCRGRATE